MPQRTLKVTNLLRIVFFQNTQRGKMVTIDRETILKIIRVNKETIKQYGISKIGLFGSYVRDEQNNNSDVDFIVIFEDGKKTFRNFMGLCFFLEDILNTKVDLLTPEGHKKLLPYIEGEIIYETLS